MQGITAAGPMGRKGQIVSLQAHTIQKTSKPTEAEQIQMALIKQRLAITDKTNYKQL